MGRSVVGGLATRLAMLAAAVAGVTYGLISWHASGFDVAGVALYNNGWRLHPVHFVALGLGLMAPALWDIFALAPRLDAMLRGGAARASATAADIPNDRKRQPTAAIEGIPSRGVPIQRDSIPGPREPSAEADRLPHTFVRPIKAADRPELLALAQASQAFHAPWIKAPLTAHEFKVYLRRTERDDHHGYAVRLRGSGELVGVVNVNNILRGAILSATVAYYVGEPHAGKGYMREALTQVKTQAFEALGLHRLEANIQPANTASIALVKRCGFLREGLSPKFLFINDAWRDHERWAVVDPRPGLR